MKRTVTNEKTLLSIVLVVVMIAMLAVTFVWTTNAQYSVLTASASDGTVAPNNTTILSHTGFCLGWISIFAAIAVFIVFIVYFVAKEKKKISVAGLILSFLTLEYGLVAICLHTCFLSIVGFITVVVLFVSFLIAYLTSRKADKKEEKPVEEPEEEPIEVEAVATEEPEEKVSLSESLATAKAAAKADANKKTVCDYLTEKYGDGVEVNTRGNRTKTGLPLADTHFVTVDGKRRCFAYVYEMEGTVVALLKMKKESGQAFAAKHPAVKKSAFPKSKDAWYSFVVDDGYKEEDLHAILDKAYEDTKAAL